MKAHSEAFKNASIGLKIFSNFMTIIVVTLLSPFFILLMIVNFIESPKTAIHLLLDKENWKPFGKRDVNNDNKD